MNPLLHSFWLFTISLQYVLVIPKTYLFLLKKVHFVGLELIDVLVQFQV